MISINNLGNSAVFNRFRSSLKANTKASEPKVLKSDRFDPVSATTKSGPDLKSLAKNYAATTPQKVASTASNAVATPVSKLIHSDEVDAVRAKVLIEVTAANYRATIAAPTEPEAEISNATVQQNADESEGSITVGQDEAEAGHVGEEEPAATQDSVESPGEEATETPDPDDSAQAASADSESPADDTSVVPEDNSDFSAPVDETPSEEPPVDESSGEELAIDEVPVDDSPADSTPVDDTATADETAANESSGEVSSEQPTNEPDPAESESLEPIGDDQAPVVPEEIPEQPLDDSGSSFPDELGVPDESIPADNSLATDEPPTIEEPPTSPAEPGEPLTDPDASQGGDDSDPLSSLP